MLDELFDIMGGAERSSPLASTIEPSELLSRIKVSNIQSRLINTHESA